MKVDHRKTQGGTRFDIEKPIVKVQVEIRANNPSQRLCKRRGADLHLRREGSQNLITPHNTGTHRRVVKGSYS